VEVLAQTRIDARVLTGQYFRWDHVPGGWVVLPAQDSPVERAELVVGGVRHVTDLRIVQP
jgi:hypothetical protein